ncbi:MAG: UDP-N-acetylglucosamine 2-epimerase (non-hydrolyzing) [Verrucomicrobiota bacterium]
MLEKRIDIIAGARPNFVKIAPIIDALRALKSSTISLKFRLIHTGQHYDREMSGNFFEELGIPTPDINLGVGSGTAAEQAGNIMIRYEKVLLEQKSDLCLVVGDVTSTMACAIAARKLGIPVAHVEAGIRSGDWSMPEEINRRVTDAITDFFFTTSEFADAHLRQGGVADDRIFFVGNTMIDTLLKQRSRFRQPAFWNEARLQPKKYFVLTLHRPANVDDSGKLRSFLERVSTDAKGLPVVFPVHPRTAKNLAGLGVTFDNLYVTGPLAYLEFNYLVEHSFAVITDSGGITEEATVLGVPCMTLRDSTERPETIKYGTNELVGTDPRALTKYLDVLFAGKWKKGAVPALWDGNASTRIVAHLAELLAR